MQDSKAELYLELGQACRMNKDYRGDVNKNSLLEIWNGEIMQLYRRKFLDNDCRDLCDSARVSGVIPQRELKVSRYG